MLPRTKAADVRNSNHQTLPSTFALSMHTNKNKITGRSYHCGRKLIKDDTQDFISVFRELFRYSSHFPFGEIQLETVVILHGTEDSTKVSNKMQNI